MFFIISIISLIILFLLNLAFDSRGFYDKLSRLDSVMHFLGGFFVAMFWSNFFDYLLLIIVLTFLTGVFWEIGEYFFGIYKFKKSGIRKYLIQTKDTIEDLFFDVLGAIVWILMLRFIVH